MKLKETTLSCPAVTGPGVGGLECQEQAGEASQLC